MYYIAWSDLETYSGLLFGAVGADVEPNSEGPGSAPNKDLPVEPVGFEELEPKPEPKLKAEFEVFGGMVAVGVAVKDVPKLPKAPGPEVVFR